MPRLLLTTAAILLSCGAGQAQTLPSTTGLPPIGITSPLGIGPALPVPPSRIPMGATEMQTPGVSPLASNTSGMGPTSGTNLTCSGIGGSIAEAAFGMASSTTGTASGMGNSTAGTPVSPSVFDGGGTTGTASGTCAVTAGSSLGSPAGSASSPTVNSKAAVGRLGIPLGSTELGAGGLSPFVTVSPTISSPSTSSAAMLQTPGVLSTTTAPTTSLSPCTGSTTTGSSILGTTTGVGTLGGTTGSLTSGLGSTSTTGVTSSGC